MLGLFDQPPPRQPNKKDRRIKNKSNNSSKNNSNDKNNNTTTAATTRHQGGDSLLLFATMSDSLSLQQTRPTKRRNQNHNNNNNHRQQRGVATAHQPQETVLSSFLSRLSICQGDNDNYDDGKHHRHQKNHRGTHLVVDSLAAAAEPCIANITTGSRHSRKSHSRKSCKQQHQQLPSSFTLPDLSQGLGGFLAAPKNHKPSRFPTTVSVTTTAATTQQDSPLDGLSSFIGPSSTPTNHQVSDETLQETYPTHSAADTTLLDICDAPHTAAVSSTVTKKQSNNTLALPNHTFVADEKENVVDPSRLEYRNHAEWADELVLSSSSPKHTPPRQSSYCVTLDKLKLENTATKETITRPKESATRESTAAANQNNSVETYQGLAPNDETANAASIFHHLHLKVGLSLFGVADYPKPRYSSSASFVKDSVKSSRDATPSVSTIHYSRNRDATHYLPMQAYDTNLRRDDELATPLKLPQKREVTLSSVNQQPHHIDTNKATPSVQAAKRRDQKKTPSRPDDGFINSQRGLDATASPKMIRHADDMTPPKSIRSICQTRKRVVMFPSPNARQTQSTTHTPSVQAAKRRDRKQPREKVTPLASSPFLNRCCDPPDCDIDYSHAMVGHHQESPVKPQPPGIVLSLYGDQPPGRHVDESFVDDDGTTSQHDGSTNDLQQRSGNCEESASHDNPTQGASPKESKLSVHSKARNMYESNNRKDANEPMSPSKSSGVNGDANISVTRDDAMTNPKIKSHDASNTVGVKVDDEAAQFDDADEDDGICVDFKTDATLLAQTERMAGQCALSLASKLVITEDLSDNNLVSFVDDSAKKFGVQECLAKHSSASSFNQRTELNQPVSSSIPPATSSQLNDFESYPHGDEVEAHANAAVDLTNYFDSGLPETDRLDDATH
eukprot:scaffold13202_cov105-Amphora_coffeaeformis.AAC.1